MCVRCDWGARGGKGTVPEGGHSMKHIRIASFALALLLLAALLPLGVFSAKAEGESTVTVETRAGQNESVEVSETVTTDADGVKTTEHAAEDYTTASGMIVDYTGKNVEYPDGLYAFEDHWTSQDANDTYEAEGGSDKSNEYRAPATEIGILIGEDDVGKTNTVPGPAVGVIETTGDVKENDADGIYDYTTTERITQSVVNVTTKSMEINTDSQSAINEDDMSYLHADMQPTEENLLPSQKNWYYGGSPVPITPVDRPPSNETVSAIKPGFQFIHIGTDQYAGYWPAWLYSVNGGVSEAEEPNPVYVDDNYEFWAQAGHSRFKKNLRFNKLYLPNHQIVEYSAETNPGNEGYYTLRWSECAYITLSDKNKNLISTYCADYDTSEIKGFSYIISNLEDADYYSEEEAKHIRAICNHGYWGQETGFGSLEAMRQFMRDSGEFTEEQIASLNESMAMCATNMAIWVYSHKQRNVVYLNVNRVYIAGQLTAHKDYSKPADDDVANVIMRLCWLLVDLDPELVSEDDMTTENTIINEKHFLKSVNLKITDKPASHANNQDADDTNDVYTVDVDIAFKVKPLEENGDDLVLEIQDQNGEPIVKARIAGPIQEGEVPVTVTGDGEYRIEGLELQEGETALKFALSGSQNLKNDAYFFTSEYRPEEPDPEKQRSQPMVGIASGKRGVNIRMDISFELDVTDEQVRKEHIWRTEEKIPHYVDIPVEKEWKDGKNADGVRPEKITVRLLADGVEVKVAEITPDENGDWKYTFKDLPKYTEDGTKEIVYTISEDEVPEYTAEIDQGTYTITNKHGPETVEKTVTKEWVDEANVDGVRPEKITVHLLADGKEVEAAEIIPDADGNWSYTFTDLPKNREGGGEIVYTVTEDPVPEYEAEYDALHITNKHDRITTEIPVEKKWDDANDQDGKRPEKITLHLLADGEEVASAEVKPDENGNWSYTFKDLPKYRDQGVEIAYTITEDPVPEYETTIDGYVITNKHVPETTVIEGKKTWIEEEVDPDDVRPVKITIRLFADGKEIDAKTVTKEDGWKWKWENLPKYKDGKKIRYTIKEDRVKNYLTKIEGFDVTNTYTTQTGDVMQPWLWIALLGVALLLGGGLLALEWISRRTE